MKLSVVIPAYNEAACLPETVTTLYEVLRRSGIEHEIVVIDDHSTDRTVAVLHQLRTAIPTLIFFTQSNPRGFGYAVRYGLDRFTGDYAAIMMADLSDSPEDLIRFYRKMQEGYDCVFGSRFIAGSRVTGYPNIKLLVNRLANTFVRLVFGLRYNDMTNAFKLYRRETIAGLRPFLAPHFNLTLELPLKAIVRDYSYAVLPNSWTGRKHGTSKLKIREMGSRYFFIMLYCLIEKYFSRGDFKKKRN